MSTIWLVEVNFSTYFALAPTDDDERPRITVTHHIRRDEVKDFKPGIRGQMRNRPSPAAELILTQEDFDIDYFSWGGSIFVSERMRQAMALASPEVQFFELDATRSAPLPRSKNYKIMEPDVTEDVSDPEKSDYRMSRMLPEMPLTASRVGRLAVRPDAAPKHDLFYDRFFDMDLLCTEAFALRVLEAGCTGMRFVDPNSLGGGEKLFRTLRGIEKQVD